MGAQLPQLPFHERKGQAGDLHKGEDPWAALSTFPAFIPTATPRLLALHLEVGGGGGLLWYSELSTPTRCRHYPLLLQLIPHRLSLGCPTPGSVITHQPG